MPYSRNFIFQSASLQWQQMTLEAAHPAWSDAFHAPGARLLLPLTLGFECSIAATKRVCDPRLALWLTPEQSYRLRRPWEGQRSALLVLDVPCARAGWVSISLAHHLWLRNLQRAWQTQCLESLQLEELLLALAATLLPPRDQPLPASHAAVERAREYLAAYAHRDDTLAQIAHAAHCSAFHLARAFKQHAGTTIHRHRTQLRMLQALDRLQQGERDIAALAVDLGFASHSHFSAVFRRYMGTPPGQMRKNLTAPRLRH